MPLEKKNKNRRTRTFECPSNGQHKAQHCTCERAVLVSAIYPSDLLCGWARSSCYLSHRGDKACKSEQSKCKRQQRESKLSHGSADLRRTNHWCLLFNQKRCSNSQPQRKETVFNSIYLAKGSQVFSIVLPFFFHRLFFPLASRAAIHKTHTYRIKQFISHCSPCLTFVPFNLFVCQYSLPTHFLSFFFALSLIVGTDQKDPARLSSESTKRTPKKKPTRSPLLRAAAAAAASWSCSSPLLLPPGRG